MKKIYSFFLFAAALGTVQAQNVEQKQTALMAKKTATWCNPCGTWGWTLFQEIWDAKINDAVLFELHNSNTSKLYAPDAATQYGFYDQVSSTPAFYVNSFNATQYSSSGGIYTTSTKNRVYEMIDSTNQVAPLANSGFDASIVGDSLKVFTKVKFFQPGNGEYYLGVYVAEYDVVKYQNGIGNSAIHHNPMRKSISAPMGDLVASGSIAANSEFTNSYTIALDTAWVPSNVNVFTVLWKKNGADYDYVNAFKKAMTPSSAGATAENWQSSIQPTLASAQTPVWLNLKGLENQQLQIEVFNLLGTRVAEVFNGKAETGEAVFNINANGNLASGTYFAAIQSNGGKKETLKFVIR